MRRLVSVLMVAAAAWLVAAAPVGAKEGVKATLESVIPLDAPPGSHLDVRWSLAAVDDQGHPQPFGAGSVFVRLLSGTGSASTIAYAAVPASGGRYSATVVVPSGGIADVQIGLRGFTSGANGTHNANVMFPITNDPLPGNARVVRPASGTHWKRWIVVAGFAGGLIAAASLGVAFARGRTTSTLSRG